MSAQGVSARLAKLALMLRTQQRALFGPGVSTPDGWDIILILYIADAAGRPLTVGDVIVEAGDRTDAGRRRVAHLSHAGVVIGDGTGDLSDVVTLSPEAVTAVEDLIERTWETVGTV